MAMARIGKARMQQMSTVSLAVGNQLSLIWMKGYSSVPGQSACQPSPFAKPGGSDGDP
jgi:hypothetical protein